MRLAGQVFGLAEWSLRLPALLAVLAVLPMVYTIGRRTLGSPAAASLVAWIFALCSFLAAYALPSGALHLAALGLCALVVCALYFRLLADAGGSCCRWRPLERSGRASADLVAACEAAASYLVAGWVGVLLGLSGLVGLYAAAKYRRSLALYTGRARLLPFAHRASER